MAEVINVSGGSLTLSSEDGSESVQLPAGFRGKVDNKFLVNADSNAVHIVSGYIPPAVQLASLGMRVETNASVVLTQNDHEHTIVMNVNGDSSVSLPTNGFQLGFQVKVVSVGSGTTSVVPGSNTTINGQTQTFVIPSQYRAVTLCCVGTNQFVALSTPASDFTNNAPVEPDSDGNLRTADGGIRLSTLKGAAPWAVIGFPLSTNWNGDPNSGSVGSPDALLLAKHCTHYTYNNSLKWLYQEGASQAASVNDVNWTATNAIDAVFTNDTRVNSQTWKRNFHLVIGQDTYNPAYVTSRLASNPEQILDLVNWRVNQIKAKYPGITSGAAQDPFDRIDVVNEITNGTSLSADIADLTKRGWRLSGNAFYTAAHNATTLSTVLGGNAEQWIWNLFTQLRAEYPTSRLAWVDFSLEAAAPTDGGHLYWGNNQPVFSDVNDFYNIARYRNERILYEIWRMKVAGIPIDTVGWQLHLDYYSPVDENGLSLLLQDHNALGVTPAITEMNVTWWKSSRTPPHINVGSSSNPSYRAAVYGAWYASQVMKVILRDSACSEVSGWTTDSNTQSWWTESKTYPLLSETIKTLATAVPPAKRTLRRSRRTEFRAALPLWCTAASTANLQWSSNRMTITGSNTVQIPWSWYGHANLGKPLSPTAMTAAVSFFVPAAGVADNTVLLGWGVLNGVSLPTTSLLVNVMANNNVSFTVKSGGATSIAATVIGQVVPNEINTVAIRVDGGAVIGCINDGSLTVAKMPSGNVPTPDTVFVGSTPDSNGWSGIGFITLDFHHNADYPEAWQIKAFTRRTPRVNTLPLFLA